MNEEVVKVISDWIRSLPKTGSAVRQTARQSLLSPTLQSRMLLNPAGLLKTGVRISLVGLDGRAQALNKLGEGAYSIPSSLPAGIYIIRVGARNFIRQLF